jgi:branched-chain amino acid transport system substrate-binding protein
MKTQHPHDRRGHGARRSARRIRAGARQDLQHRRALGRRRDGRHQLRQRPEARLQGDQRGGGILGRKVDVISSTRKATRIAKALTQKAVDDGAYVVMGPVFSGSIIVSMAETKKAEIPTSRAAKRRHHAAGQPVRVPHVVHAIDRDAEGREVHARTRQGEDGRDHVGQQRLRQGRRDSMVKALESAGIKVAPTSRPTRAGRFSGAVLKAKQSNADALFVYTNEEESARALRELKKQGYDKPIIGETTLTGQKVIELAGEAANGAVAHVGLTVDAPQPGHQGFDEKFQKEYKYKSDHNGMKGYSGMYVVKAITEKIGKFDGKAFAKAMHGATIAPRTLRACCSTCTSTTTATSTAKASWSRSSAASRSSRHAAARRRQVAATRGSSGGGRSMGDFVQLVVSGTRRARSTRSPRSASRCCGRRRA